MRRHADVGAIKAIGFDPAVVRHDVAVNELIAAGLGLDYETIRLDRTAEDWLIAGCELLDRVAENAEARRAAVVLRCGAAFLPEPANVRRLVTARFVVPRSVPLGLITLAKADGGEPG
ncbi:MAG: hypothetical protein NVS3B12_10720 [Acidimicrobiales bacterium]